MTGEAITALIGAYEPGPAGLRALIPLAGATLVEQQARRAFAAGAGHVLLLIEEVTPELAAAIGRLRLDGLEIGMVAGIDAAADALADQVVLLIADACLPETDVLRDMTGLTVPAVATLADEPEHARHERIDATVRWAGVALIDGHRVAETATMLGSWDPVSTLLRRAVQDGATRLAVDAAPPMLLVDQTSLEAADAAILAAARTPAKDWISRTVFAATEELAVPQLLARRVDPLWPALLAAGLAIAGGATAWVGWRWPALIGLLLSGPIAAAAGRLARVQARPVPFGRIFDTARTVASAVALGGLAKGLAGSSGQWGWWLVAALIVAAIVAGESIGRIAQGRRMLWLATTDTLVWAMLPFAAIGRWNIGMAVLAAYACLSFAYRLRELEKEKRVEA